MNTNHEPKKPRTNVRLILILFVYAVVATGALIKAAPIILDAQLNRDIYAAARERKQVKTAEAVTEIQSGVISKQ